MKCIKIINDTKFMLVSFDVNLMYTLINVRCTRAENVAYYSNIIVMLQIFDNLFHYKNILTVQWIKRLKLCMVTMVTLPPAKELKIQVVSRQNEIRTLDVLLSPTWLLLSVLTHGQFEIWNIDNEPSPGETNIAKLACSRRNSESRWRPAFLCWLG